ncbi:HNH endonuclease, partial [Burkholderia multivorans]
SVGQAGSAEEAPGHRPHDGDVTSALAADTPSPEAMMPDTRRLSRHSMLSDEEWSALSRFAPEVLDGITGLTTLNDELRSFERHMGPEEAVMLTDALEALD